MKSISKTCLFGRSSRKREAGQTAPEYTIVISVITIAITTIFVILSGGISAAIERVVELYPT
ncbi:MAG: hypothetical protein ABSC36_06620 [Gaiellaceae bacterium]|jgi:Flp pilus assembly pilin Flp